MTFRAAGSTEPGSAGERRLLELHPRSLRRPARRFTARVNSPEEECRWIARYDQAALTRKAPVAMTLTSGLPRSGRAVLVALLTLLIAGGCHASAGGTMPGVGPWIGMFAIAVPVCWLLSAHRWSIRELVALFLLAQSATHLLGMALTDHSTSMDGLGSMAPMLLSHVAGCALLVGIVRWGEGALWALVSALTLRPLRMVLQPALRPMIELRSWPSVEFVRPQGTTWPHVSAGRAPPALAAR